MLGWMIISSIVAASLAQQMPGDNCVDVSRYGEVQYNQTQTQACTYQCDRVCEQKQKQICVNIPKTVCRLDAGVDCSLEETDDTLRCDKTEERTFVSKKCVDAGTKPLTETKKMPHCENVTKEQCDEKWVIDEEGNKGWGGNINCKPVTWMECKLIEVEKTTQVPVHECVDDATEEYLVPVEMEEQVKCYKRKCVERAEAVCDTEMVEECVTVNWEECQDTVEEKCRPVQVTTPWQQFDHLMRCALVYQ